MMNNCRCQGDGSLPRAAKHDRKQQLALPGKIDTNTLCTQNEEAVAKQP
jgi:hypothetical protein